MCIRRKNPSDDQTSQPASKTSIEVVELRNYSFKADTFFEERENLTFQEVPADPKYAIWTKEAIEKVNGLITVDDQLPHLKIKLIFEATITSKSGKKQQHVPISIIESYQEPKTDSIRLGMLELKDNKQTFLCTVAHEYSHLIFENASRKAGTTSATNEQIEFWSKPAYEGLPDLMMGMALNSTVNGDPKEWYARSLNQFQTLEEAKKSKDNLVLRAKVAFRKIGLTPQYPQYTNWISTVGHYLKSLGGSDPYSEGTWLAGSLLKIADTPAKQQKLARLLVARAKSGEKILDLQLFYSDVVGKM